MKEKFKKSTFKKEKVEKTSYFVEKKDGRSISKVYFPSEVQVGLKDNSFKSNLTVTGMIKGAIQKLSDGITNYLQAGSGVTITNNENGSITISSSGGGSSLTGISNDGDGNVIVNESAGDVDFRVVDDNSNFAIHVNANQGSIQFFDNDTNDLNENDTNFFVRGTANSRGTSTRGTAMFEGDVTISGSLWQLNKPGFAICDKHFYLASNNPATNTDFHLRWHDGGTANDNPESAASNHFWKYFPYGGEILSVFATGGDRGDASTANPFSENLIFAVYEWTDAFAQSTTSANSTPEPLGHMTASVGDLFVDNTGAGSYLHRSVYDFTNSEITGSMIIPRNQRVCFAVKSNVGSIGFERTTINVVYKLGLK